MAESVRTRRGGVVSVLVVVAAVVAVGALSVMGFMAALGEGEVRPWSKPATVDGTRLKLTYVDTFCQDHEDVDVQETEDAVTITVRTQTWALSCSDANMQYTVEVQLVLRV